MCRDQYKSNFGGINLLISSETAGIVLLLKIYLNRFFCVICKLELWF